MKIAERQRQAVYWKEDPSEVRRCSWFYKASLESRYIPYEESVSDLLEKEYKEAMCCNQWHKTIPLENGEEVIMYSAKVRFHWFYLHPMLHRVFSANSLVADPW